MQRIVINYGLHVQAIETNKTMIQKSSKPRVPVDIGSLNELLGQTHVRINKSLYSKNDSERRL